MRVGRQSNNKWARKVIKDLTDKVAVITGAASGIGRSSALAMAAAGARVVVADINEDRMEEVRAEIADNSGRSIAQRCDVSSDEELEGLHQATLSHFGPADIVMNNVGILMLGTPENIPLSAWERTLDINVLSIVRSIHTFLPEMLKRGSGHFVNTASTAGLWGYSPDRIPYAASKAAIIALSESLAIYTRPRGVGVTCLCPGPVSTNIAEQVKVFGVIGPVHSPSLSMLEPDHVALQVLHAIQNDIFLLPTHNEVFKILVQRAADPEAFLAGQVKEHSDPQ